MLSVANVQGYDDDATHVGFHGKGVEVVVVLIVPADLRYYDPLDEGMHETACEEDTGIVFVFVGRRCLGHGRVCRSRRSLQRSVVRSADPC